MEEGEYHEFLNFDYYIEHSLRLGIFQWGSPHYFLSLRWNVPCSKGKTGAWNEYGGPRGELRAEKDNQASG